MPTLAITNNGTSPSAISAPNAGISESLPAGQTTTLTVTDAALEELESQLDELRAKADDNGEPLFAIDVSDDGDGGTEYAGVSGLVRWVGNHVTVGTVVSDPTSAPTVSARRVDIASGELMVDGEYFAYAGSTDETGDAEIGADGTDLSATNINTDVDVYMHVLAVNNASTLEIVFVRGTEVDNTGSDNARLLNEDELAAAVQSHLSASAPVYGFVQLAHVLYEESTGLTDTTTSLRPVPAYA